MPDVVLSANYIAATAAELRRHSAADRAAGVVSQRALFPRRGRIELSERGLVLSDWGDSGDLTLSRQAIVSLRREFTSLYGRFMGGLLNAGKPLILRTTTEGEIYLLINRREIAEFTSNRRWQAAIAAWQES
ncbi:hypothetical protein DFR70_102225 [Nocardia tenerifensis]|uniref:Uncharacterized protein n=1 Tax=Nocardia tenerifensis TaxID=228006 RepID=A0A318K6M6_9NOCA|nr:hypothetical protein [Nocardia tenerifensis]PXX68543.1 hypothetical protein DFR70_102225 [Nocardia tenerifensis]